MKKIFTLLIAIICLNLLTSCAKSTKITNTTNAPTTTISPTFSSSTIPDNKIVLPDLTGLTREEIDTVFSNLDIEILYSTDGSKYYGPDGYNKFVKYSIHDVGDLVNKGSKIRIITSPLELPEIDVSALKFERDLSGKSFIDDSYGYCTWAGGYADGDTAYFTDNETKTFFRLRYLCIDTPEVSHGSNSPADPWGVAAQNYMYNLLRNAETIFIESQSDTSTGFDVYNRYLGYVWVDGVCLNLLMIAEGYSTYTASESSCKYHEIFSETDYQVRLTGRRFFGEYDPSFDYS